MFWKRLWRNSKGQSLVEFALILMLTVIIILGTLDMGIILYRQNALSSVAKDIVRAASVGHEANKILSVAVRDAEVILPDPSGAMMGNVMTITGTNESTITAVISPSLDSLKKGDLVEVTLTYNYEPLSFFLDEFTMSTQSATLVEKSAF